MENENPQPAKRPRTANGEMEQPEDENALSQHPELWFEDGNIILQVQATQFKVHRSVLSNQSEIFKDMLAVPQPPSLAECPVVVLHDSALDVESVLLLLYDTMRLYNFREKMSLSVLGSMLRLGRKYQFKHFITEALHCLNLEFPSDFDLWDVREGGRYVQDTGNSLFDAFYIAHENSIKSILPSLYLIICCRCRLPQIIAGLDRPGKRPYLKTGEPQAFLQGREKLFRSVSQNTMAWLMKSIFNAEIMEVIWLVAYSWEKNNLHRAFCGPCDKVAKEAHDASRKVIWDMVPQYFGIKDEDFDAA
ncbi:hypothetical protein GALMADRAFT_138543 [Galerina marginata CBS 339.88]|uniref:BTB domain-containing protein n=1 Tax=Galerina marginata (strain CBS 339.88) TaxID=685588 RepID=A0A067T2U9_GALM3|nr:hypothetical protein GALMADRAFT_138543 [Galerina marginata CBS 339.88]